MTQETPQSPVQTPDEDLELKVASLALPANTARANAARDAYRAGWRAADQVAAERPRTHPADRHLSIHPQRLASILTELPKTGEGWLSGKEYDLRSTQRQYATTGYTHRVAAVTRTEWLKFLAENPDQATPEMLQKRKRATHQQYAYGSATTTDREGLKFLPITENGNYWMYSELEYNSLAG